MSGNSAGPGYISLGHEDRPDFSDGSLFPDIFEAVEQYMARLSEFRLFLSGISLNYKSGKIDRLHKQLFRTSILHPQYLSQDADYIINGISALREYATQNEYEEKIIDTITENKIMEGSEQTDSVYLNSFLDNTELPDYNTKDISGIEISKARQALVFWPDIVHYEFSDERDTDLYDKFYNKNVENIPMSYVKESLEHNGLEILEVVEEFLQRHISLYNEILVDIGLLPDESEGEPKSDGGDEYRIDPQVIGSVGLSVLGVIAIAGGIGANSIPIAVSGCVAVLSAIQNWPYDYKLEIQRLE